MMPSLSSAVENFVSPRSNSQTVDAFLQLLLLSPLRPPSDPKHALDKNDSSLPDRDIDDDC